MSKSLRMVVIILSILLVSDAANAANWKTIVKYHPDILNITHGVSAVSHKHEWTCLKNRWVYQEAVAVYLGLFQKFGIHNSILNHGIPFRSITIFSSRLIKNSELGIDFLNCGVAAHLKNGGTISGFVKFNFMNGKTYYRYFPLLN
ncbi:hypothetical protein [Acidiphilium sp.]|uniref:hypothetical protein n=1 Tax=Acidiphilium sp. TaxID=527 RepID=UPI00259040B9|nr:hypothetical protein [Acidiphilium sp.]